jgi:hypothetical protein
MQETVKDLTVSFPMPIFVVGEDVGWWQGVDGSANNEPFRNSIDLSSVPSTAGTRTRRAVGRSNSTRTRNNVSSAI